MPKPDRRDTKRTPTRPKSRPTPRPKTRSRSTPESEGERLHAYIAHSGLCSRRAAEKLILEGRVELNGGTVTEMGVKVVPGDVVLVDGQVVQPSKHYTVLLNKPIGVVTTLSDPQRRPTIVRYLPDYGTPLKPVGRLDMDTSGLIICTNDGDFAHRLAHPSFGIEKEYQVIVEGIPTEKTLNDLRKGVFIEGRRTSPAKVEVIHAEPKTNTTGLKITIHEGRKRQIRVMCDLVGHPVKTLKRVRIGPLRIRGMKAGECRLLGKEELNELRSLVELPPL